MTRRLQARDRDAWSGLLGPGEDELPRLLVLESTPRRQDAPDRRLPDLGRQAAGPAGPAAVPTA